MENESRYTQNKQNERDDVSVALIRQDLKYVRSDIAEIKQQLKDERQAYVTQAQLISSLGARDRDIQDLKDVQKAEKERATFYSRTVIVGLITALLSLAVSLYLQAHK